MPSNPGTYEYYTMYIQTLNTVYIRTIQIYLYDSPEYRLLKSAGEIDGVVLGVSPLVAVPNSLVPFLPCTV